MWLDSEPTREIFLVFMNTEFPFSDWFKDGFKHVYSIERQALGWLCTDPSKSDLYTYILPATYHSEVMIEFRRQNPTFTILHLKVKPHCQAVFPSIGVLSCVTTIQYMLGVYWPFIFTPYQLYNRIKRKPPKHIEVIECHDIKSMQHKGKHKPQQQPQTVQGQISKPKRKSRRKGKTARSSKHSVF